MQLIATILVQRICRLGPRKFRSIILRLLLIFSFTLVVLASTAFGQPPEPAEMRWIEDMYLAKDDGSGQAGDTAASFSTTDIPIYCVVLLSGASPVTVKMNLVAVTVPGVKTETRVVSTSYTTKDNQNRVNFSGRPDKFWTAGKYRVDVFIDGTLVKKLDFEIRKPAAAVKSALGFQPIQPAKPKSTTAKRN